MSEFAPDFTIKIEETEIFKAYVRIRNPYDGDEEYFICEPTLAEAEAHARRTVNDPVWRYEARMRAGTVAA